MLYYSNQKLTTRVKVFRTVVSAFNLAIGLWGYNLYKSGNIGWGVFLIVFFGLSGVFGLVFGLLGFIPEVEVGNDVLDEEISTKPAPTKEDSVIITLV